MGCGRSKEKGQGYCCLMCYQLADELTQLEALCRNTDRTQLSAQVWAAAVAVSDAWTEYLKARDLLENPRPSQAGGP